MPRFDLVILGLSITSSWGNGHATTYRALVRELARRGRRVLFLERDVPWYAQNRDLPNPPYARTELYASLVDLQARFAEEVRAAKAVVVGSYVPEGPAVCDWVIDTAGGVIGFYDIDTPVTLTKLARGDYEYLTPELIPLFDVYLSFTGGPLLRKIEREYGAQLARPLYCSVDPELYRPGEAPIRWDLGYLGTYSADRQGPLESLLCEAARQWPQGRFVVAGPMYPREIDWPVNVERIEHLPPAEHAAFYQAQRFTLNITRADMIAAGYSPSVRLFEAAACGTPILSDAWPGLETILQPEREIVIVLAARDVLRALREMPERERVAMGAAARTRVLTEHTGAVRAAQLEACLEEARRGRALAQVASRRDAAPQ